MFGTKTFLIFLTIAVAYYVEKYLTKEIEGPVVTLITGKVKGVIRTSRDGRMYYANMGIPYAKPPIGDLRFKSPKPVSKWEGIRDASKSSEMCSQVLFTTNRPTGSEDCLYINVFTPKLPGKSLITTSLPVMVWIHGGGFVIGSGEEYRPDYFMDQDVVIVSMNYRLGALGFLNTGDKNARGNQGLKDQSLALKWIQTNIKQFGGDPTQVTLFGESAGGASTHFHMLSQMSKDSFHRVISQSGVANGHWAVSENTKGQAKWLGQTFGCNEENSEKLIKCLNRVSPADIANAQTNLMFDFPSENTIATFTPSVETINDEEAFITEHPEKIIKSGNINKVDWLTGVNSEEGLLLSIPIVRNETHLKDINDRYDHLMPIYMEIEKNKEVSDKIKKFYFGDLKERIDSIDKLKSFTDVFSDKYFNWPMHEYAILHSKQHPVYLYYYTYKGSASFGNILMRINRRFLPIVDIVVEYATTWINRHVFDIEPPNYGVAHVDEVFQLLKTQFIDLVPIGSRDYEFSKNFVKLWVDFAYGRELKFKNVKWQKIKEDSVKYLELNQSPKIIDTPFLERIQFWRSITKKY